MLDGQVEQYGEEYQNQSWGPVIALVKENRPPAGRAVSAAKDRGAVKEMFLTLNGYIQVHHQPPSGIYLIYTVFNLYIFIRLYILCYCGINVLYCIYYKMFLSL